MVEHHRDLRTKEEIVRKEEIEIKISEIKAKDLVLDIQIRKRLHILHEAKNIQAGSMVRVERR